MTWLSYSFHKTVIPSEISWSAPESGQNGGRNFEEAAARLTSSNFLPEGTMPRKYKGNMNGQQYVAHVSPYKREVHDLDNETRNCLVDEIIRGGKDRPYSSLVEARSDDYSPCPYCLQDRR